MGAHEDVLSATETHETREETCTTKHWLLRWLLLLKSVVHEVLGLTRERPVSLMDTFQDGSIAEYACI